MMNTLGLLFHIHLCILNVYDRELYTFEYLDESSGWVCVRNSLNSTRAVHFVSYYNYIINKVMFGNNLRSTLSRPTFIAWFFFQFCFLNTTCIRPAYLQIWLTLVNSKYVNLMVDYVTRFKTAVIG